MKYKTGDHFYIECTDGTVDGWTVIDKQPSCYIDEHGKREKYEMLKLNCDDPNRPCSIIEDYNVDYYIIDETDPRVVEYKKRFTQTKIDLDKACEWLYSRQAIDLEVPNIDEFINDFRKAMED